MTTFLIAYCVATFATVVIFDIPIMLNFDWAWNTPCGLHKHTKMNWCGCIITSIFLMIMMPYTSICKLLYWLFHIH